jgi:hypothetical protein
VAALCLKLCHLKYKDVTYFIVCTEVGGVEIKGQERRKTRKKGGEGLETEKSGSQQAFLLAILAVKYPKLLFCLHAKVQHIFNKQQK